MRGLIYAAVAASVFIALPTPLVAQERDQIQTVRPIPPVLRQGQRPAASFQTRSAAARLSTANRLGANVTAGQMTAPFSLTPRSPFVENRGWFNVRRANFSASPPTGAVALANPFINPASEPTVEIELIGAAGRRFLVDCTVESTPSTHSGISRLVVRYETVGAGPDGQIATLDVSTGLMSFVTPVFSPGTSPQNTDRRLLITLINNPPPHYFFIYGCEITPLQ